MAALPGYSLEPTWPARAVKSARCWPWAGGAASPPRRFAEPENIGQEHSVDSTLHTLDGSQEKAATTIASATASRRNPHEDHDSGNVDDRRWFSLVHPRCLAGSAWHPSGGCGWWRPRRDRFTPPFRPDGSTCGREIPSAILYRLPDDSHDRRPSTHEGSRRAARYRDYGSDAMAGWSRRSFRRFWSRGCGRNVILDAVQSHATP
jgi:hypothetical protein